MSIIIKILEEILYRKRKIIKILRNIIAISALLPLILSFLLAYIQLTPEDKGEKLSFSNNKEFKIIFISGILENTGKVEFSAQNKDFLFNIIENENPDFVVLGGDNLLPSSNISELILRNTLVTIDEIAKVFNQKKTYFSILFGNFDNNSLYDKFSQTKRYMRSNYFVGNIEDNENVRVYASTKENMVNYKISLFYKDNQVYNIFLIDTLVENDILESEYNFYKNNIGNEPNIIFSYDNLFSTENIKTFQGEISPVKAQKNFYLGNTKGIFASGINKDFSIIINEKDNDILCSALLHGARILPGGEIENNFYAKIITLKTNGGLSVNDYQNENLSNII